MVGSAEVGIPLNDGEGVPSCGVEEVGVLHDVCNPELRHSTLSGAEKIARPTQFKVFFRYPEAVGRRHQGPPLSPTDGRGSPPLFTLAATQFSVSRRQND